MVIGDTHDITTEIQIRWIIKLTLTLNLLRGSEDDSTLFSIIVSLAHVYIERIYT